MKSLISILFLVSFLNFAQNKSPYQLFDKNGKKVSYKKLLKNIENADVLLFGEYPGPSKNYQRWQLLISLHCL